VIIEGEMKKVEGLIEYFDLQEWWFSTFTEIEREYIDNRYQPMGMKPHKLTRGKVIEYSLPAPEFLNALNTWFKSKEDSNIADRIHLKLIEISNDHPITKPGYYQGRHFTTWVRDFETLKKNGDYSELEKLLLELVNATKTQSQSDGMGVAPAYYNELAILYRKQKETKKEILILERFAKQKHSPGVMPGKLLERLEKTKEIANNQLKD
jgi:hypothetical protein